MDFLSEEIESDIRFYIDQMNAAQNLFTGLMRYNADFADPFLRSMNIFNNVESSNISEQDTRENWDAYMDLMQFNLKLWGQGFSSSIRALGDYFNQMQEQFFNTIGNLDSPVDKENFKKFFRRNFELIDGVENKLPRAIKDIEPEYGFHFEHRKNALFEETERFTVYQVHPTDPAVKVDEKAKPILIIPPFVLGANILGFLPKENRSYAHSFANQGIPTYIRLMKDIHTTPAFQTMTMEDETLDTRYFCEKIMACHGKKVTINGYCQGGYSALCHILTGELDHAADALITCVAPMDGTRSPSLGRFLKKIPSRFNDLRYGVKTLANGNEVVDGHLISWVYKLKSISDQAPLVSFFKDMAMVDYMNKKSGGISKTAAALNYWMKNERIDLPLAITQISFASYHEPIADDGTLPVKLFDRKLNLKTIEEKKIPWLLCYGEDDDLVEKEAALAPTDFINIETTPFPKGHVAIATSWSHPESDCALQKRFGPDNQYRGPVRFQMDLNSALDDAEKAAANKNDSGRKQVKKKPAKKAEGSAKRAAAKPTKKKTS